MLKLSGKRPQRALILVFLGFYMEIYQNDWPLINVEELAKLPKTTEQVHRAAQFLAMAGKFFLPNESDDSHTNMGWDKKNQCFTSRELPTNKGHQLMLHPSTMELRMVHKQTIEDRFLLMGKTMDEGVNWIKQTLGVRGLNTEAYQIDLHYDIPDHELFHGQPFLELPYAELNAFSKARTLGDLVISDFSAPFEHASPVRTWPHHFDVGSYIPLMFDSEGNVTKSISSGFAIRDQYVGEYYFYLTHWAQEGGIAYNSLPPLPHDGYWNQQDWTGAVLKLSDLIKNSDPAKQKAQVTDFMNMAHKASLKFLGIN